MVRSVLQASMSSAETFRAREVYRYYQPRNLTESPENHEHAFDPAAPPLQSSKKVGSIGNFKTQQSFSDTALTAFAQLIALRLVCQRAIVSLIDHENEYFLAESTSTLSLIDANGPAQNAWLSISGARVPRRASLCEQTLSLKPNQDTTAEMTPVFFVPDLRLDDKMSKLDCVTKWDLRFYCGVALTNKRGVNIGCVYVVDDRPRSDFSLEQAQFLTTMAATVMDHLENIRAKEDIVRVTMMSQALHAFIEGDGTMDGDWQRLKRYNLPLGAGVGYHWETNKDDGNGAYVNGKKELGVSGQNLPSTSFTDFTFHEGQSPLQHGTEHDARFNFNNSPWSSSSETATQALPLKSVFEGGRDTEFSNNGFATQLHSTFSRASNLIREGLEVDGAVYFDAPFRFYQGRSTLETDTRVQDGHESSNESCDEDFVELRPGPSPRATPSKAHRPGHPIHSKTSSKSGRSSLGLKSEILGYSTKASSSLNNQTVDPQTDFTAIDQSLLTSLVRRYPQGQLFVFDENGPISPQVEIILTDDSELTITSSLALENRRARRKARKEAEILRLLIAFPGARQIFFVPLYDSTSGCFIGSFTWSTSATRIFSIENHLSYLVAFGHSVMSEVSRLNTLSADRAKGDFISNVSHELRSPLHGILASVEFLADSTLDGFQRNLVDTVDICGRTLLDTIEHVLDFSKIKKFGSETMQPMGTVADLDVSAVIEEVLEGVFAGFEFNGLSSQGLADTTRSRSYNASQITSPSADLQAGFSNDALSVILDIDFRENWKFPTVPGTWKRITMNLFGNALKYTPDGFIKIKLEARSILPGTSSVIADGVESTMVTLAVSDSGKGMSPEFMKTKLFMPFSQEDPTVSGTGLGMSIVKQIVDLSGGMIDVRSELGKGTEVKLSLPLTNCLPGAHIPPAKPNLSFVHEDPIETLRRRALGRTVTIRGFDSSFGDSNLRKESLSSLKESIEKYVTEWFKLTIVSSEQVADIVISDESAFLTSAVEPGIKFRSQIILCSNSARRNIYMSRLEAGQTVEFVSKPCGPHRIAKALLNCLDTEDALAKAGIQQRSSIGFSPTTGNIAPGPYPPTESLLSVQSSSLNNKMSTGFVAKIDNAGCLTPDSMSVSNENSGSSSNYDSASSPSMVDEESSQLGLPSPSPRKPRMLLVEDNPVNMMLLATYMKKNQWEFEKAENGFLALQAFQSRPEGYDVIFMDVSMPIMTGYESTRAIRTVEADRREAYNLQQRTKANSPFISPLVSPSSLLSTSFPFHGPSHKNNTYAHANTIDLHLHAVELKLNPPALIIALTGFSSQQDQETAFESGVDVFMTKPVRFREVGRILEGWMKSRETGGKVDGGMQKRDVDEGVTGAKRSG